MKTVKLSDGRTKDIAVHGTISIGETVDGATVRGLDQHDRYVVLKPADQYDRGFYCIAIPQTGGSLRRYLESAGLTTGAVINLTRTGDQTWTHTIVAAATRDASTFARRGRYKTGYNFGSSVPALIVTVPDVASIDAPSVDAPSSDAPSVDAPSA